MRKRIYAITTIGGTLTFENFYSKCVGFYFDKETALEMVRLNNLDINELNYYPYAIVEEIEEGIYQYPDESGRWWFHWNEKLQEYEPTEIPEGLKNVAGFGIG